jgi:hypothetical protein
MIDEIKKFKILITLIPIINHIIYLIYSFLIDKDLNYFINSFITLPPLIIGQLFLYIILKIFNEDTNIAISILVVIAIASIYYYIKKIINYDSYQKIGLTSQSSKK